MKPKNHLPTMEMKNWRNAICSAHKPADCIGQRKDGTCPLIEVLRKLKQDLMWRSI